MSAAGGMPQTQRDAEGGSYESLAGYSRGVRIGPRIAVSGTTARGDAIALDTHGQMLDCLQRIVASVERLGGRREEILRTRVFLAPTADWEQAAEGHRELLGDVAPANTMLFVARLIGEGLLVEVEADAEIGRWEPPGDR